MGYGTYFQIQEAIRKRTCNICGRKIEGGTHHIKFCSNSRYDKNLCIRCLYDYLKRLVNLNNKSILEIKMEE